MKISGSRSEKFLVSPPEDVIGVLLYGPDRGLVKTRAEKLARLYVSNPDDVFATTVLTADDLQSDPAKLSDEMVAMSLLGDDRLIRVRLDHERPGAMISKLVKAFDGAPKTAEAKLIIEAGDLSPRSAVRKAFEAGGHFAAIGCYLASTGDITNLVRSQLTAKNIAIDRDALDLWVPLLQGDRSLLINEVDKMILYKGDGNEAGATVTLNDIQALAAGGQTGSIDDIIMSAMSGNPDASDGAFQRAVAGKINSAVILRSLQRHLTRLMEARAHIDSGSSAESAMRSLRPPVFRMQERVFSRHLQIWPSRVLRRALSQSIDAENQLKSAGAPTDAITGRLLLALASYAQKRN